MNHLATPASVSRISAFLLSSLLALLGVSAQTATFTPLGDAFGDPFDTAATALSKDGTLVVGSAAPSSGSDRLLATWENGAFVSFGPLWEAKQVKDVGRHPTKGITIVGFKNEFVFGSADIETAAYWNSVEGVVEIPGLPATSQKSRANAISADGKTIVGTVDGHAFHWNETTGFQTLEPLYPFLTDGSTATGVSPDGNHVTGTIGLFFGPDAYRWDVAEATIEALHGSNINQSPLSFADGFDITDDDLVVGIIVVDAPIYYGVWGGAEELPLQRGALIAVSTNGTAVGYSEDISGPLEAVISLSAGASFVSLKNLLVNDYGLNLAGWTLNFAVDVSEDGRTIVGSGTNPDGNPEAWVVTFSESPATPAFYDAWIDSFGLPAGETGLSDNPSGDELSNLLKFAFNLDPTVNTPPELTPGTGTSGLPHVSRTAAGGLRIEYLRRRVRPGLNYRALFSENLGMWEESGTEVSVTIIDTDWERVVVEDTSGTRQFGQVEVSF